jgi:hypothetical protein
MACDPTASDSAVKDARAEVVVPAVDEAPRWTPVIKGVAPSKKLAVPVRSPVPAPVSTVATKLTADPNPDGLGLEVSAVVVDVTNVASPAN